MLMAYIDVTQRLLRKIEDQKDRNESRSPLLRTMLAINMAHQNLGVIPYRLVLSDVRPVGIGRSIWRLAQATQLAAEYSIQSKITVSEQDVVTAYHTADDDDVDSIVFLGGNVSPMAQRKLRRLRIFSKKDRPTHWTVQDMDPKRYTAEVVMNDYRTYFIDLAPETFRYDTKTNIWDIVR